jgi:soluble lytic murein transglycosylase
VAAIAAAALAAAAVEWRAAAAPATAPPPAAGERLEPLVPRLAVAAAALRDGDCAAARAGLGAAAADDGGGGRLLVLVAGLYDHACADPAAAVERLWAAAPPAGAGTAGPNALEDWRLLVLADSAAATGRPAVAEEALAALVAGHPASPLRPAALVEAAELGLAGDAAATVAAIAARAREEGIEGEPRQRLELLAWQAAQRAGDAAGLAAAARGLLVHHPQRADEVGALAALAPGRATGAAVDWAALLSADELARRAEALLAAGRPDPALAALAAVPPGRRDVEWQLAAARAEIAAQRGLSALLRLRDVEPADPAAAARVDWQRVAAAREAARVRRGREPLPADERDRLRRVASGWLERVAAQTADRPLAARALSELFAEHWDGGRFEAALAALVRLREIDPTDATGARKLWEAGWNQYRLDNPTGAIGYWAELGGLYADSSYARAGRYWSARAFESLGERPRAAAIYRELAGGEAADFYVRNARARAAGAPAPAGFPLAADRGIPWPSHPDFARARLLTDLGLDALAASELTALTAFPATLAVLPAAPPERGESRRRAAAALEALILARRGEPRTSIRRIYDAFPALGGPFQAAVPAAALRLYYPLVYGEVIADAARRRGLPPHLVLGMVRQESAFDVGATSHAGARGLMQLMPATAREVAKRIGLPFAAERLGDPAYNVALGTSYFDQVLAMFDGNVELALAGYNGGPYRIRRLWREAGDATPLDAFVEGLPVEESRIYTKRILLLADSYRQLYPQAGPTAPLAALRGLDAGTTAPAPPRLASGAVGPASRAASAR